MRGKLKMKCNKHTAWLCERNVIISGQIKQQLRKWVAKNLVSIKNWNRLARSDTLVLLFNEAMDNHLTEQEFQYAMYDCGFLPGITRDNHHHYCLGGLDSCVKRILNKNLSEQ
jgi:hypothetical protein